MEAAVAAALPGHRLALPQLCLLSCAASCWKSRLPLLLLLLLQCQCVIAMLSRKESALSNRASEWEWVSVVLDRAAHASAAAARQALQSRFAASVANCESSSSTSLSQSGHRS
jgi:hypothetical protein